VRTVKDMANMFAGYEVTANNQTTTYKTKFNGDITT
jgi:hypothetical protein